ncbi:D-Ala-D-Ala carboxypeptidase family metallohydrolase [Bacteroidales bacterium OttesenSCG-928-M06]|nr:D-Ala-D-Ala carboxypeptidase family metallohydrolase [Bacteroidales bacterium OttesenSCG-928-M06]
MNLTKNFTLTEMTSSVTAQRRGILNVPNVRQTENLRILCERLLQPLRDAYGKPLFISSGYRCRELNEAVKGSPSSDHMQGRAADIVTDNPVGLFAWVCRLRLSFDQAIIYKDFLHLSYRDEKSNRKIVLEK